MEEESHRAAHPWKARFFVSVIMLILSFIGLVISEFWKDGSWNYWRVIVPVFALLCLWLSWYLRRKEHSMSVVKIWHELLHWVGLIVAVYLVTIFVNIGVMGRFEAGLMVLTMLALTIFIAGIYIENTFMVIGIILGLFSAGASLVAVYLYSILLPATIIGIGIIGWIIYTRHKKHKPQIEKQEEIQKKPEDQE